ncbi:MAG: pilus assembly protein PilP [Methylacidiphilales bacterium]|nr:pilus assembly protein PilP [Candidatus Methylacidiphilales bacterium]
MLLVSVVLAGCGKGTEDINKFIEETNTNLRLSIKPIPGYKPVENFEYTGETLGRDPFTRKDVISIQAEIEKRQRENRTLEPLESYPIESFTYLGFIVEPATKNTKIILQTSDGLIKYAKLNEKIGTNNGRIKSVNEAFVEIIEEGSPSGGDSEKKVLKIMKKE